jgi:hypothetical protein
MKKFTPLFIVVSLVFIYSTTINAQLFNIGVGGGLTQVMGPDQLTNDVSDNGIGFSTEYNFGAMAKLGLPLIPITPRGFILYHQLSGEGELPAQSGNNVEYSQSILTVGLGVQYQFIPVPAGFDPYLALDLLYNNFGEFKTTTSLGETTNPSATRFGAGVGLGTAITIIPLIDLDVMLSYQWLNLTGKEEVNGESEETISVITLDAFLMFNFL